MKKANILEKKSNNADVDEMLPEYQFDYQKARPNRFATEITEGSLIVVLEPEIAQVFRTQEAVKAILSAIAKAMSPKKEQKAVAG
jgi:hypothetical protein